ncbi:MAG: ATP-binding protein [Sulfurimicrobium sp.]|nr:ATP-binding protein [Sulfurimicrobium sp.]
MTAASSHVWRKLIEQSQQALYQARDETQFCDEVCRALLDTGIYTAAWISLASNNQKQEALIVARAGLDPQDCSNHPCLEMQLEGNISGYMGLSAREQSAFDDDTMAWLKLVIQTLSFGISEQRQCVKQLQETELYKVTVDRLQQQIFAVDQHVIISITDKQGVILYANDKFCEVSQYSYNELVGANHNIVNSGCHSPDFFGRLWGDVSSGKVWRGEVCNRRKNGDQYWVGTTIVPFSSPDGKGWHYVCVSTEITSLKYLEEDLLLVNEQLEQRVMERTRELELSKRALEADVEARREVEARLQQEHVEQGKLIEELKSAQQQLLQSEKMASIGQLAAGVAHEINNPVGYLYSNLGSMEKYLGNLFSALDSYERLTTELDVNGEMENALKQLKQNLDLEFLKEDIPALMVESKEGITRVKKIVQDLKDFSHVDEAEWQLSDLHRGLDSTLNIVWNELKYKAEVIKEYGALPEVECIPSQLNQVFMNLLVNAGHAIENRGTITIRTSHEGDQVWVEIADTGKGIEAANLKRIFEPFFTTKPVGKGTGLGLSLSYGIVTNHHGSIQVESNPDAGTKFRVWLPVKQAEKK